MARMQCYSLSDILNELAVDQDLEDDIDDLMPVSEGNLNLHILYGVCG